MRTRRVQTRKLTCVFADGTTNDAAHIDFAGDATIIGIDWSIDGVGQADGERIEAELSLASSNQIATNDALNILSVCGAGFEILTSGMQCISVQKFVGPLRYFVEDGARLYLHTFGAQSAGTYRIQAIIHLAPEQ